MDRAARMAHSRDSMAKEKSVLAQAPRLFALVRAHDWAALRGLDFEDA